MRFITLIGANGRAQAAECVAEFLTQRTFDFLRNELACLAERLPTANRIGDRLQGIGQLLPHPAQSPPANNQQIGNRQESPSPAPDHRRSEQVLEERQRQCRRRRCPRRSQSPATSAYRAACPILRPGGKTSLLSRPGGLLGSEHQPRPRSIGRRSEQVANEHADRGQHHRDRGERDADDRNVGEIMRSPPRPRSTRRPDCSSGRSSCLW